MSDKKREAVERTAARLQEQARKSGGELSHDKAKERVIDALRGKGNLNR